MKSTTNGTHSILILYISGLFKHVPDELLILIQRSRLQTHKNTCILLLIHKIKLQCISMMKKQKRDIKFVFYSLFGLVLSSSSFVSGMLGEL